MTGSGVTPANGDVMHAHITYDGTTLTLLLTDTTTSASFTASEAVNIPTVIGASTAYVGFTAGMGGLTMTSNILNWTFTPSQTQAVKTQTVKAQAEPALPAHMLTASAGTSIARPMSYLQTAFTPRRKLNTFLVKDYEDPSSDAKLADGSWPVSFAPAPALMLAAKKPVRVTGEPHFRPAPGKLARSTDISLASGTPDAVIHYTIDGAQPTNNSAVYHGPINVTGTALTIKAFAARAGMKDSPVVTGMYRIGD